MDRADDVAEIRRLMHSYCELFDSGRIEQFTTLFARATLTFVGLDEPCVGSAGLQDFIDRRVLLYDGRPRTNHVVGNVDIDVAPDRLSARATSHVTVLQATRDLPLQVIGTARYADRYGRDDGGWYFAERRATGLLRGDMSQHLRLQPSAAAQ